MIRRFSHQLCSVTCIANTWREDVQQNNFRNCPYFVPPPSPRRHFRWFPHTQSERKSEAFARTAALAQSRVAGEWIKRSVHSPHTKQIIRNIRLVEIRCAWLLWWVWSYLYITCVRLAHFVVIVSNAPHISMAMCGICVACASFIGAPQNLTNWLCVPRGTIDGGLAARSIKIESWPFILQSWRIIQKIPMEIDKW